MKTLAIIPARGGSKRIPGKNIKPFCGVPMLTRAIAAARDSLIFDRIIVSTDCEDIAALARASGAETPFRRPDDLSDDHATTIDVIAHGVSTMHELGFAADAACCLYPCTPFTTGTTLRSAFDNWAQDASAYLFPVCSFPSAPQRALKRDERGFTTPLDRQFEQVRTQDLEPAYYDAGQFYWGHAEAWIARRNVHSHGRAMVVDWLAGIDIDTPEDWQKAELLYQAFRERDITP